MVGQTVLWNKARRTPKPYRMNMSRYKVPYPREGEEAEFTQWLAEYETKCRNFNVCKFSEQVGARHSVNELIRLHDEITGVNFLQPLA